LYRKNALMFMAIACTPHLVYFVGMALMQAAAFGNLGTMPSLVLGLTVGLAFLFVYFALIGMSQAATAVAVSDVYLNRPTSVSAAYKKVRGKGFRYFGIVMGIALLTGVGLLLLIVPGIYFAITYALTLVASANENLGWSAATKRSKELVKGNRSRVAVIFLLSLVISWSAIFGFTFLAQMLAVVLAKFPLLASLTVLASGFLANTIAAPVALIGFTLAYYDARVRKEAFDLQLMMEDSARATAASLGA
jgi:hypothetical protein